MKNGNINITGKYAAGRNITVNKYANFKWLIFSLSALVLLTTSWVYREEVSAYWSSYKKFSPIDSQDLRILILPFEAEQEATLEVNYVTALKNSLEDKKDTIDLAIKLLSIRGIESPKNKEEARSIGLARNADLVIWGSYAETEQGPENVRLRYLLLKDFELPYTGIESGDRKEDLMHKIEKLREGYLQKDLNYLINWIEGISAFKKRDYAKSLKCFEVLQKDSTLLEQYDSDALTSLSHMFLILGREEFTFPIFDVLEDRMNKKPENFMDTEMAAILSDIGVAYDYFGNTESSLEYHHKAIELIDNTNEKGKDFIVTKSALYSNLGLKYLRMTQYEQAEKYLSVAQNLNGILMGQYDLDYDNLQHIVSVKINFANLAEKLGRFEESLQLLHDVEQKSRQYLNSNDMMWGYIFNNIAKNYQELGEYTKALEYQYKAIDADQKIYDANHTTFITNYNNLAVNYERLDSVEQSLHYQKMAIEIAEYNGDKTDAMATLYSNYAINLADAQRFKVSIKYNQKSIDLRLSNVDAQTNANLAISYNNMSYTYRKMEQFDLALDYHLKTIEISEKLLGADHFYTGVFYQKMAESYKGKKDFDKALECLEKSEKIYVQYIERDHPHFADLIKMKQDVLEAT